MPAECVVDSADKLACASQTETECEAEGCCWEDDPGYPYCFEKRQGIAMYLYADFIHKISASRILLKLHLWS